MSAYVAAYDISHDEHRERVARILMQYGRRVQWSVFEIELAPGEVAEMQQRVGLWLARDDAFDLFPLDRREPERRVSWQREPYPTDAVVVV